MPEGTLLLVLSSLLSVPLLAPGKTKDRRQIAAGRARCAIRAVDARVVGISHEWSGGTCELSPGRIRFSPKIGIVGDREIDVVAVLPADLPASKRPLLAPGNAVVHVVRTSAGDLYWAVPEHVAAPALRIVAVPGA